MAQCGTRIPAGTGFGNLVTNYKFTMSNAIDAHFLNHRPEGTHCEGGRVDVQLVTY